MGMLTNQLQRRILKVKMEKEAENVDDEKARFSHENLQR
jgi:hypothetical protein